MRAFILGTNGGAGRFLPNIRTSLSEPPVNPALLINSPSINAARAFARGRDTRDTNRGNNYGLSREGKKGSTRRGVNSRVTRAEEHRFDAKFRRAAAGGRLSIFLFLVSTIYKTP